MSTIERLASAIAFLSNAQLDELVEVLVRDYEPRAERLAVMINFLQQDKHYVAEPSEQIEVDKQIIRGYN